jgi:DtxR family Mn-dependent transcriptional regulator
VVLASDDGSHAVSKSVAETVSVRADPAPAPRPPLPDQLVISSDRYGR